MAVFLLLGLASPAAAQSRIDANRLPIDLARIQKQLQPTAVREERQGLNLHYFIDVYGQAPRPQLFTKDDNLTTGPVPYGAPTHQEFMNLWTPQEFRAPAADFTTLLRWLAGEASKKKSDTTR